MTNPSYPSSWLWYNLTVIMRAMKNLFFNGESSLTHSCHLRREETESQLAMCKEADSTVENPDGVNKAQIRNTTVKELGTWEVEAGRTGAQGQCSNHSEFNASLREIGQLPIIPDDASGEAGTTALEICQHMSVILFTGRWNHLGMANVVAVLYMWVQIKAHRQAVSVGVPVMVLTPLFLPLFPLNLGTSVQCFAVDLCICFHQLLDEGSMMTIKVVINLTREQGLLKKELRAAFLPSGSRSREGESPNRLDRQNPVYAEEASPSVIVNGFSERLRASHIQRIRPHSENLDLAVRMKPILLQGHEQSIMQIKYNHEGDLLFTVAKDPIINIFDFGGNIIMFSTDKQMEYQCFMIFFDLQDPSQIDSNEPYVKIPCNNSKITSAVWGCFGACIIAGHESGELIQYSAKSGEVLPPPCCELCSTFGRVRKEGEEVVQSNSYETTMSQMSRASLVVPLTLLWLPLYPRVRRVPTRDKARSEHFHKVPVSGTTCPCCVGFQESTHQVERTPEITPLGQTQDTRVGVGASPAGLDLCFYTLTDNVSGGPAGTAGAQIRSPALRWIQQAQRWSSILQPARE
ncbi:hypothetical protein U0070_017906 [Myodes glareolus]|uniref:Uncharacterized protein n=1 Tax=Myodes glareolus TaxID=447135 RepID=A0AAW0K7R8_MYOGA